MTNATPVAKSEPEWAAYVAIDWADQKHYWKLVPAGSQRQEQGELQNTPEAVETWAAGLQQRFGGRPIAVCLEQARGALVYMLTKYAHLVLFPVHPTTAARYRETFCTSDAKDDPNDTGFLLDLLLRHRERLRQLQRDTVETRLLQFLVEDRRRTVNERTRQSNRLTNCLKQYFPLCVDQNPVTRRINHLKESINFAPDWLTAPGRWCRNLSVYLRVCSRKRVKTRANDF